MSQTHSTGGADGRGRRPNLFIVGAPKAGTTSLYEYLRGHPQVFMSPVKEPAYFSPDIPRRRRAYAHPADEARYLELYRGATGETYLGEASTAYLASRVAPKLISDFSADPRYVVMLRNPVDVMYSRHAQRLAMDADMPDDFEAALAFPGNDYVDRVRFGEQLERWFTEVGREAIHVIVFEDFRDDTATSFQGLLEFLEIDADYKPATFAIHNPSHERRKGAAGRLLRNPLTSWTVNTLLPRTIGQDRTANLARRVRLSGAARRQAQKTPLAPDLRARLEAELAEDVAGLSHLLDRDLNALWFNSA